MKALIIDPDPGVVADATVSLRFRWPEAAVMVADRGDAGLELFFAGRPEVVLLEIDLPDRDGFGVLGEIRRFSDAPVLLLTGRRDETDHVRGLELGADDCLVKPFGSHMLLARLMAVLRRARGGPLARPEPPFERGDLVVDFATQEVRLAGVPIELTRTEYRLLCELVRHGGRLLSHGWLLERVWSDDGGASVNSLKTVISRLRAKLGRDGRSGSFIESERGRGYRFGPPSGEAPAAAGRAASRSERPVA